MTRPIEVKVDLEANASYVRYRRLVQDEHVDATHDLCADGSVAVDVDSGGNVLGIEVLGFDRETLEAAKRYAHEHRLAFPSDLAAVAPAGESLNA
jgi:uncharacterized protein YuzE